MTQNQTSSGAHRSVQAVRPKPWGCYRRAVRIASDGSVVHAEMEDDVHHFALTLTHQHGIVVDVTGEAIRTPWSICPGALEVLGQLQGKSIGQLIALPTPARAQQCMHLYDLVLLAARHAEKQAFVRQYRVEGDYDQSPPLMRLWCDDIELLSWSIAKGRIIGSRYDGLPLNKLSDAIAALPEQDAEAALILRRSSLIAAVRALDLDKYRDADELNPDAPAVCYARQPERSADAARSVGSGRDFHGAGIWPLG